MAATGCPTLSTMQVRSPMMWALYSANSAWTGGGTSHDICSVGHSVCNLSACSVMLAGCQLRTFIMCMASPDQMC